MKRAVLPALAILALAAIGALLAFRDADRGPDGPTTVSGTITGRDGPVWLVRAVAETEDGVLAEAWTGPDGRYSLDVPPNVAFELKAMPSPGTLLIAEQRALVLRAGESRDVGFDLEKGRETTGWIRVVGPPAQVDLTLKAVPANAPPGTGGVDTGLRTDFAFRFGGLDPDVRYRLETDSLVWGLAEPVTFRGGDRDIVVPVRRVLSVSLRVLDAERNRLPSFTVKVLYLSDEVLATVEGTDGYARWQTPHPHPEDPRDLTWTLHVESPGFFERRVDLRSSITYLQPVREPNLTLLLRLEDGTPFAGEVTAWATSRGAKLATVDPRPRLIGRGRYSAVLPPGRWRLMVDSSPAIAVQSCEVDVPEGTGPTVVEVPPLRVLLR